MVEVESCENECRQLPVRLAQMLIITIHVHTICYALFLLYHACEISYVNLVLFVIGLEI